MRPSSKLNRRCTLIALAVILFAGGTACGNEGSVGDNLDRAQNGVDKAQDSASKAADALSSLPTSAADAEKLAKEKGTDLLTRDANLENNSTCSKAAGDIMKLSKLQEWKAGPYSQDIQYSQKEGGPYKHGIEAVYEPLNNKKKDADPYRDWSFDCSKHNPGFYRVQFISGAPNLGQVSGPVVVIVME